VVSSDNANSEAEGVMKTLIRIALVVVFISIASAKGFATCATDTFVSDYSVTQNSGTWTYNYFVQNGCAPNQQPLLTDFFLPYFSDANVSNIGVPGLDNSTLPPTSWAYTIEAGNDLFNLGAGAGVIDFQVTSLANVADGEFLPGVGYYGAIDFTLTSNYAPVKGPYAMLLTNYDGGNYDTTTELFGDPSIPGSPDTLAALKAVPTPEPDVLELIAAGLCVIPFLRSRLRRTRA
jgi:hypothetical protein